MLIKLKDNVNKSKKEWSTIWRFDGIVKKTLLKYKPGFFQVEFIMDCKVIYGFYLSLSKCFTVSIFLCLGRDVESENCLVWIWGW